PIVGVSLATQGAMANYQRDLEKEADLTGISYLTKTSYSPVAMLTLMEHLAQADKLTGRPDLGPLYQDHPVPDERVDYIRGDLVPPRRSSERRIVGGSLATQGATADGPGGLEDAAVVAGRSVLRLAGSVPVAGLTRRERLAQPDDRP